MIVKESGGTQFPQAPTGLETARCYGMVDIGTHTDPTFNVKKRQLIILFELSEATIPDGDHAGEPFRMSCFYTASLHEKAKLRKHLESWRGREFTAEELGGFDLSTIIGAPATLNLVVKNERTVVDGVMAVKKGVVAPKAKAGRVYLSLEPAAFVRETFNGLPDWIKEKIEDSPEYKQLGKAPAPPTPGDENGLVDDDDVPF